MKAQWHTPDEKPEPYTSVLAKWEDGSLGLVYVTHINQWKLSGYGVLEGSRLKFIWTNDIPQPTEEDFKLLNK